MAVLPINDSKVPPMNLSGIPTATHSTFPTTYTVNPGNHILLPALGHSGHHLCSPGEREVAAGDIAGAQSSSRTARTLVIVPVVVGAVVIGIALLAGLLG